MIFITVGEQLPFDRLIRTVDEWAGTNNKEVFAQIGRSDLKPSHIEYKKFLTPQEFSDRLLKAELVIAHAGMGTIISALEKKKPILVMPRQAILGEVRNEHQSATARRFLALDCVSVAFDEFELMAKLECLDQLVTCKKKESAGSSQLIIQTIRDFIAAK